MARREKKLPWLRLWADAIDDEKLALLSFEERWHFIAVLCMKRRGMLDANEDSALRDRKIGAKLGLGDRERDEVRRRLCEVGLIAADWQPTAWDKRQRKSDYDSTYLARKRRQRKQQSRTSHAGVTRDMPGQNRDVTKMSPGIEEEKTLLRRSSKTTEFTHEDAA